MLDFEEVPHPEKLLYKHIPTGNFYIIVDIDDDGIIWQPANLVLRDSTPLLEAPQPVLQIPQRVQGRAQSKPINGYYSGIENTVEGEILSEEIVQGSPVVIETIKRLPIEGKLLLLPALIILVFFGLAVPVVPKVVKSIQQASSPAPVATGKATDRLRRIYQLDQDQYDAGQYDAYSQSACSAASLTEAFNSYGADYRISVVLGSEIDAGVITPDLGLVNNSGITKTANRFGFDTQSVSGLDQAISTANNGTPVVVDLLPGTAWPHGHFLDIIGGDDSSVKLADSWSTNFKQVDRARFLRWNPGQMFAVSPSQYSVLRSPTVSADQINAMLAKYHSPVAGQGQVIVDLGAKYHIDPAYVVATFGNESTFGTSGEAKKSLSPGNLRCIKSARCADGYAQFDSWKDGFEKLYDLLANSQYYIVAGNTTPDAIIPIYAPSGDGNSPSDYIAKVKHIEDVLRSSGTQI